MTHSYGFFPTCVCSFEFSFAFSFSYPGLRAWIISSSIFMPLGSQPFLWLKIWSIHWDSKNVSPLWISPQISRLVHTPAYLPAYLHRISKQTKLWAFPPCQFVAASSSYLGQKPSHHLRLFLARPTVNPVGSTFKIYPKCCHLYPHHYHSGLSQHHLHQKAMAS